MATFDQRGQKVNTQYNADKIEVNHSVENKKGSKYSRQTCALCKGNGKEGWFASEPCKACGGKGTLLVLEPAQKCPYCNGKGSLWDMQGSCPTCNGTGWVHILDE